MSIQIKVKSTRFAVKNEIKAFIIQTMYAVLNDPDFGLELSEKAQSRLHRARLQKTKTIPFSEIKNKYALR